MSREDGANRRLLVGLVASGLIVTVGYLIDHIVLPAFWITAGDACTMASEGVPTCQEAIDAAWTANATLWMAAGLLAGLLRPGGWVGVTGAVVGILAGTVVGVSLQLFMDDTGWAALDALGNVILIGVGFAAGAFIRAAVPQIWHPVPG
jgi:hypothetical protein